MRRAREPGVLERIAESIPAGGRCGEPAARAAKWPGRRRAVPLCATHLTQALNVAWAFDYRLDTEPAEEGATCENVTRTL